MGKVDDLFLPQQTMHEVDDTLFDIFFFQNNLERNTCCPTHQLFKKIKAHERSPALAGPHAGPF
jgi:hypothetical protein